MGYQCPKEMPVAILGGGGQYKISFIMTLSHVYHCVSRAPLSHLASLPVRAPVEKLVA